MRPTADGCGAYWKICTTTPLNTPWKAPASTWASRTRDSEVVFSIKNVSATPLNISPDELTERFVRGDTSRTTEGSGLGLSIAKDLTQLQGGRFEITIDGDLFKAELTFAIKN